MSKGITLESMLSVLPGVLSRDEGMYDLAQLIGWILEENGDKVDSPAVFQNIDELDEDLLDILAKDCKVDWYDYDADVEVKRRQIKSNWHIRKHLGTVNAVKTALQNVWPDTTVEEWFDYGGSPGYFRVLLGVDDAGTVDFDKAVRMIEIFKPVRAHMDGYPILRVRCGIVINTSQNKVKYHVPIAGTIPRYSTHGDKSTEDIVILTEADGPEYHVPITGQVTAGTHPNYSTHGDVGSGSLSVSAPTVSVSYGARKCGTSNNSLF